jgi:multidrug efflux pump subunit AcrA (membrane-fusion protein)
MNKRSVFQLFLGIICLAVICASLVVYVNYANSRISSTSAVLKANSTPVGTEYGGQVTQQLVNAGDRVTNGQKLFSIKSTTLIQALNSQQLQRKDLPGELTDDNQLTIIATTSGYISEIKYPKGSYVPSNSEMVTITNDETLTVSAKFSLTPTQYAQATPNTPLLLTLPGGSQVSAVITGITIDNQSNPLIVTVNASMKSTGQEVIKAGQQGTPAKAYLVLNEQTYWARINRIWQEKSKSIGSVYRSVTERW